ncbi:MAG TPA: 50S ribosomal protein L14 [Candidatus Omnitrophota bacterium]|nr:50S ribosomal protein L14 [Candidatus Omnitrophota bacterium]HPB67476.1 50S ribosomal protein L14 [Candidatus Omnitrophota bacterium]HQO57477.1 50S ribosomal protein L14 [Candidatus Omnitrophota bacterium]HQP11494.1 50S ribosomal protein L14 [Candidatus Omnitrophota bacterium]
MLYMKSILTVADNSGARRASMIGVLNSKGRRWAQVGDVIKVNIKEAAPDAAIKKGTVATGVVVRTKFPIKRADGTTVRFDNNALVIIDEAGNPKGTRVFGPVARELRNLEFMKIISLAPEVV